MRRLTFLLPLLWMPGLAHADDLPAVAQELQVIDAGARSGGARVQHLYVEMRLGTRERVAERPVGVARSASGDRDVRAVVAVELHVGAVVADALDDRSAREVGRSDYRGRLANHRAELVGLVGVTRTDRGDVGARRERACV